MPYIPNTLISAGAGAATELFYAEVTSPTTISGTTEAAAILAGIGGVGNYMPAYIRITTA